MNEISGPDFKNIRTETETFCWLARANAVSGNRNTDVSNAVEEIEASAFGHNLFRDPFW